MGTPGYTLTTGPVVPAKEALNYLAEALDCQWHENAISSAELRLVAWIDPPEEYPELAAYLSVAEMLVVTIDEQKGLDGRKAARAIARAFEAVAGFLGAHPGPQAVIYEDTSGKIYLHRDEAGEIKLSTALSDPEDLNYSGAFNELARRYQVADLGHLEL